MGERRGDCRFWREALKRKLIPGAARAAGRGRPCLAPPPRFTAVSRAMPRSPRHLCWHCARAPGRRSLS